jgi:hypothetical protein
MKKILTTALVCIFGLTMVKAQIAKGNLFVGSSFGFASYTSIDNTYNFSDGGTKQLDQKIYDVNLNPAYGVFVTDHLILGGMFNLDYNNNKTDIANFEGSPSNSTGTNISSLFSIGPFVRYYFFDTKPSNTLLYIQAGAALGTGGGSSSGSGSGTTSSYVSTGKLSGYFLYRGGFQLGVTHFIQGNLGLDISLGYDYLHEEYTDNYNTATTTFATGVVRDPLYSAGVKSISNGITFNAGLHYFIK